MHLHIGELDRFPPPLQVEAPAHIFWFVEVVGEGDVRRWGLGGRRRCSHTGVEVEEEEEKKDPHFNLMYSPILERRTPGGGVIAGVIDIHVGCGPGMWDMCSTGSR